MLHRCTSAMTLAAALALSGCAVSPGDGAASPPASTGANTPAQPETRPERAEAPATGMQGDCISFFPDCTSERPDLDTEGPATRSAADSAWRLPQFEIDPCQTSGLAASEADIECAALADVATPIGPEMGIDDEAREQLTLGLYEGGYAGDIRLTMRNRTGVGMQWLIPFPR